MKNLSVQLFIKQHKNWERILTEKPYCLQISREQWNDMNLVMLKYNQIESDFNEQIVRECRGLILNEDTYEVVTYPFQKFGNVNEGSWVEKIDWNDHPYILDKIDGSLIKIVNINNNLLISTNGTIDAFKAPLAEQIGCDATNFGELVIKAIRNVMTKNGFENFSNLYPSENPELSWLKTRLLPGYTYMFELTSPWNRVVVNYKDANLWFIGCRDNNTYQEIFIKDHILSKTFDTPALHEFGSFDECIETAKNLPWNEEGYVITSRDFKRNKAKSLGYLSCHHLKNNGVMSYARAIELVRLNEVDEVLAYFPEFKNALTEVKEKYWKKVNDVNEAKLKLDEFIRSNNWDKELNQIQNGGQNRKTLAVWVMKNFPIPGLAFGLIDGKIESVDKWFAETPTEKMVQMLGFKQPKGT